ncbi:MAG: hypothetical protein ABJA84_05835 [Polaromonas sp.]
MALFSYSKICFRRRDCGIGKFSHGTLNDEVVLFFASEAAKPASRKISDTCNESDAGHGRVESRRCVVSNQIDWLEQKTAWSDLTSIAMIEQTRECKGRISVERRFFITR